MFNRVSDNSNTPDTDLTCDNDFETNDDFETPLSPIKFDLEGFVRRDIGVDISKILRGLKKMPDDTTKMVVQQDRKALQTDNWEYPGWGSVTEMVINDGELPILPIKHQLDVYRSTAIAGNDLLASVLYTTGLVCQACGQLAPFAMLICIVALYPFRGIFTENGTALPLNGGVYVQLLNSASKMTASFAASCSLISYAATAVVSAASCTSYASGEFGDSFPVFPVTIAIMVAFSVLVTVGVKDSANIATLIFAFHILTLIILIVTCLIKIGADGGSMLAHNWSSPLPIHSSGDIIFEIYLPILISALHP